MINSEQRQQLHRCIVLDLAIRSLQHDYKLLENAKMKSVFIPLLDSLLKDLQNEYFNLKRLLAKQKIRFIEWKHIDTHFSDIYFTTAGDDQALRYANQALKATVEEELINRMNAKNP